jgi:predicted RNase H-like HicB family nuclease
MEKIILIRIEDGWKAYADDDDTVSAKGKTVDEALEALATIIKFFN